MITRQHPEWPAFKAKIEEMIEEARRLLEQDQPEAATAALRGEIRAYRAIIELVEPTGPEVPTPTYSR